MQRLHNIDKWAEVPGGKSINFGGSVEPRLVRLDVNAPEPVLLYYSDGNGETWFLAYVHGRDVIEFRSTGEFSITVEGGPCWMYTIDGQVLSFVIDDAVKITKLIDRRPRDPQLELMQYQMKRNMDDRIQAIRDEMERALDRRLAAAITASAQPSPSSDGGSVPDKPTSAKSADVGGVDQPADGGAAKK